MNDLTKKPRRIWKEVKQGKIHIDTGRLRVIRPAAKEISVGHHLSKTVCNAEI